MAIWLHKVMTKKRGKAAIVVANDCHIFWPWLWIQYLFGNVGEHNNKFDFTFKLFPTFIILIQIEEFFSTCMAIFKDQENVFILF